MTAELESGTSVRGDVGKGCTEELVCTEMVAEVSSSVNCLDGESLSKGSVASAIVGLM